jgi:hypothetical protein
MLYRFSALNEISWLQPAEYLADKTSYVQNIAAGLFAAIGLKQDGYQELAIRRFL